MTSFWTVVGTCPLIRTPSGIALNPRVPAFLTASSTLRPIEDSSFSPARRDNQPANDVVAQVRFFGARRLRVEQPESDVLRFEPRGRVPELPHPLFSERDLQRAGLLGGLDELISRHQSRIRARPLISSARRERSTESGGASPPVA